MNMFGQSDSISASIGPQLGNDLYQGMTAHGGSSRGRGYSGSLYGGHQSNNNTHHPSMLAMDAVDDDDDDDLMEDNHHEEEDMIYPPQGHAQRHRLGSNERDHGRQTFGQMKGMTMNSRFGGLGGSKQGYY